MTSPAQRHKPSALANLGQHLRYRLDQIFAGGSFGQVALLSGFTMLVILFGMSAWFFGLFNKENSNISGINRQLDAGPLDALWWSAKHVFDPSFFDSNYGASWPVIVISLIVSILGMIVFATLLGFVSSGIDGRVAELRRGNSAVKERGHVLILGWSDKVFSILDLLEDKQEPVKVVVLSHHSIEEMNELLRVRGRTAGKVKIILRTGAPTSLVELSRVAFESAFSIIVLGDQSAGGHSDAVDVRVIKTLMLLAANREWAGAPPKMVAEIVDKDHLQTAQTAAAGRVSIVCSGRIISRVIVQTSRQPAFSRVYSELFGFAGNEIYIREFPGCAGLQFGALRACFPNAIPIGVSRSRVDDGLPVFVPLINPGTGYVVQPGEWIICVAADDSIAFDPSLALKVAVSERTSDAEVFRAADRILILGWNDHLYDLLSQFDGFMTAPTPIIVAAAHTDERAAALLREHLPEPLAHARVQYERLDTSKAGALARLKIGELSQIIILADDSSDEPDPDSRTIMTVLALQALLPALSDRVQVVAEVVDADNCELLKGQRPLELVVSPEIVSMLLTQLSQQLMLEKIYEDLLSAGGSEIYLRPMHRYTDQPERCTFDDLAGAAMAKGELAIGYLRAHPRGDAHEDPGVHLNPPRAQALALTENDRLIVISADAAGRS